MKLNLNPKNLSFVEADDKCAVFRTKEGHEIKVALGKLSDDNRQVIEAMAKGGVVGKSFGKVKVKDTEDRRLGSVRVKDADEASNEEDDEKKKKRKKKDKYGNVVVEDEEEAPEGHGKVVRMAFGGDPAEEIADAVTPDVMAMPSAEPIPAELAEKRSLYNKLVASEQEYDRFGMPVDPIGALPQMFTNEGVPTDFQPDAFQRAAAHVQMDKEVSTDETSAAASNRVAQFERDNQARVDAGLPPMPLPPDLQGGTTGQPPAPLSPGEGTGLADASAPPPPPPPPVQAPIQASAPGQSKTMAGINAMAKAEGDLGQAQSRILQEAQAADQKAMAAYEKSRQAIMSEREALQEDIRSGQVDPNRFWTGDPKTGEGGHSRIAAGIGMIIAGFNPTNSPNAAINFLKFQMEQDLQAQAKNLSSKENLLSANLQQFGELRAATEMTRIMQNDILKTQLEEAAAKAKTPMAKAAALQAAGKIEAENGQKFEQFAKAQATRGLISAAEQDPAKMNAVLSALEATNPEMAKDYRQRAVPGLGFAFTLEGANGLREMQTTVKTIKSDTARLKEILNSTGKSLSPDLRKEADGIRTRMIGRLRVPMTGPGAMSEGERELLMNLIPGVTGLFSKDSRSKVALESLEKSLVNNYRNQAIANGIRTLPQESSPADDRTAKAKAWLADPANAKSPYYNAVLKDVQGRK